MQVGLLQAPGPFKAERPWSPISVSPSSLPSIEAHAPHRERPLSPKEIYLYKNSLRAAHDEQR